MSIDYHFTHEVSTDENFTHEVSTDENFIPVSESPVVATLDQFPVWSGGHHWPYSVGAFFQRLVMRFPRELH